MSRHHVHLFMYDGDSEISALRANVDTFLWFNPRDLVEGTFNGVRSLAIHKGLMIADVSLLMSTNNIVLTTGNEKGIVPFNLVLRITDRNGQLIEIK